MVRRGSVWCGRGVAQLVARWLAERSARHHREVFPTEHRSDEEMERCLSEWRRINVLYECMYVCYKIWKINKKSGIMPPNIKKKINHPNCHKQYFLLSVIKCISDFLFKLNTQEPNKFKSHTLETWWWVAYSIKSMLAMAWGSPEPPDPLQPILQLMLTPIFRPKD